jgi:hypothetical protein
MFDKVSLVGKDIGRIRAQADAFYIIYSYLRDAPVIILLGLDEASLH